MTKKEEFISMMAQAMSTNSIGMGLKTNMLAVSMINAIKFDELMSVIDMFGNDCMQANISITNNDITYKLAVKVEVTERKNASTDIKEEPDRTEMLNVTTGGLCERRNVTQQ